MGSRRGGKQSVPSPVRPPPSLPAALPSRRPPPPSPRQHRAGERGRWSHQVSERGGRNRPARRCPFKGLPRRSAMSGGPALPGAPSPPPARPQGLEEPPRGRSLTAPQVSPAGEAAAAPGRGRSVAAGPGRYVRAGAPRAGVGAAGKASGGAGARLGSAPGSGLRPLTAPGVCREAPCPRGAACPARAAPAGTAVSAALGGKGRLSLVFHGRGGVCAPGKEPVVCSACLLPSGEDQRLGGARVCINKRLQGQQVICSIAVRFPYAYFRVVPKSHPAVGKVLSWFFFKDAHSLGL